MTLADTHAHLYWDSFQNDLDAVIKRAKGAGVSYIINIGVDVETSKKALRQAQRLNGESFDSAQDRTITLLSSIGIHPEEALRLTSFAQGKLFEDIEKLEEIYKNDPETVVAVGECGLDFLPDWAPNEQAKNLQRKLFQAQIDLAKKLNLPLLVHCRDDRSKNPENTEAWDEVIKVTKDHFGIYHCYSGLPQTTRNILQNTCFYISFAGNLTYPKNEYLREATKQIPLKRIALETDCPFLPPQSNRGEQNEPAFILETAQTLAELKGASLEYLANQTTANVKRLLKIE